MFHHSPPQISHFAVTELILGSPSNGCDCPGEPSCISAPPAPRMTHLRGCGLSSHPLQVCFCESSGRAFVRAYARVHAGVITPDVFRLYEKHEHQTSLDTKLSRLSYGRLQYHIRNSVESPYAKPHLKLCDVKNKSQVTPSAILRYKKSNCSDRNSRREASCLQNPIIIGSQTTKALMLCRWQTSSYRDACLQLPVNYFVRVRKKQSVRRVGVTCLLAVTEVVPSGSYRRKTVLDPGSAEGA